MLSKSSGNTTRTPVQTIIQSSLPSGLSIITSSTKQVQRAWPRTSTLNFKSSSPRNKKKLLRLLKKEWRNWKSELSVILCLSIALSLIFVTNVKYNHFSAKTLFLTNTLANHYFGQNLNLRFCFTFPENRKQGD